MLKGIDPFLGPDLLRWLAEMGHGDVLAVVDRNFPSYGRGQQRVWQAPAVGVDEAFRAVLTVFPLDTFVEAPIGHMLVDDGSDGAALADVRGRANEAEGREVAVRAITRVPDFYDEASRAYATIRTGETRPYSCYLLTKGVV